MKNKNLINKLTEKGLTMLERRAEKKANAECLCFIYEPKVPKKLKKTICMGLACLLTVVTVLVGSSGNYYAADSYSYRSWSTVAAYSGGPATSTTVSMYNTNERYQWTVTSHSVPSGYGCVKLTGVNNKVVMVSGTNMLTDEGSKQFKRTNPVVTAANPYMRFKITMDYDSYTTVFSGNIKILSDVY